MLTRPTFRCKVCQKTYVQLGAYKRHMLVHQMQKQRHRCPDCDSGFVRGSQLDAHRRRNHKSNIHHACQACDFRSHDRLARDVHFLRVHARLAPLACEGCAYTTADPSELKAHYWSEHHTEIPYHPSMKPANLVHEAAERAQGALNASSSGGGESSRPASNASLQSARRSSARRSSSNPGEAVKQDDLRSTFEFALQQVSRLDAITPNPSNGIQAPQRNVPRAWSPIPTTAPEFLDARAPMPSTPSISFLATSLPFPGTEGRSGSPLPRLSFGEPSSFSPPFMNGEAIPPSDPETGGAGANPFAEGHP